MVTTFMPAFASLSPNETNASFYFLQHHLKSSPLINTKTLFNITTTDLYSTVMHPMNPNRKRNPNTQT